MGFLLTKITDEFRLVYEGDPALKKKPGEEQEWIAEKKAKVRSGQKPDVMVCRPLSGDEVLRIMVALDDDPSLIVQAAALGVKGIEMGDGTHVTAPKDVREILSHAGNLDAVTSLAQTIVHVSREGVDRLPFRDHRP